MTVSLDLEAEVLAAVTSVDDPEYPGVSIVDLGLLERLRVHPDRLVEIDLIPTFAGCPALGIIAEDVRSAVRSIGFVDTVMVRWVRTTQWTPDRMSQRARDSLADAFTVAVEVAPRTASCPRCGTVTAEQSMFGPSRCRSVHRCESCNETVEVMRA
ncbi:MAG: iron-sulfur cluster assembly protein [Ilumatobacter sp.]